MSRPWESWGSEEILAIFAVEDLILASQRDVLARDWAAAARKLRDAAAKANEVAARLEGLAEKGGDDVA